MKDETGKNISVVSSTDAMVLQESVSFTISGTNASTQHFTGIENLRFTVVPTIIGTAEVNAYDGLRVLPRCAPTTH